MHDIGPHDGETNPPGEEFLRDFIRLGTDDMDRNSGMMITLADDIGPGDMATVGNAISTRCLFHHHQMT